MTVGSLTPPERLSSAQEATQLRQRMISRFGSPSAVDQHAGYERGEEGDLQALRWRGSDEAKSLVGWPRPS